VLVGLFTEVDRPIVNGVVASIDALRAGLRRDGIDVITFVPHLRGDGGDDDGRRVRFPSLPLPTPTGYRLCIPYLGACDRTRARALDIAHAHSPFVSGWFAAAHARRMRIPLIYTYHTRFEDYAHYAPFASRATRNAMIALTRAFANRADVVIAPTSAMRERLREIGVGARIDVVPSAIDGARFARATRSRAVRALLGARGDADRIVLVVARLAREKNVERIIDALPFLAPDIRVALVGDGPQRAALEARAAAAGASERVRFVGALDPAVVPGAYASADAFAFTSRTETQGLVLGEAQAAGLPIAAIDSPVAREMGAPQTCYAADDARALAAAVGRALAAGPAAREPAGRWSPAAHAAAVAGIYAAAKQAQQS
jgi:glycosyltransferase involved in cell wall biosynthesis